MLPGSDKRASPRSGLSSEEEGEGGKSRDQPWRGRESHASTLGACRSARHCDEVHRHCAVASGDWRAG